MASIRALVLGDGPTLEAFLQSRIESSILLLSNLRAAGLSDVENSDETTYFGRIQNGLISGVVALTAIGTLISQSDADLEKLCLATLHCKQRPLRKLTGPKAQIEMLESLLGLRPANIQDSQTETLYALELEKLILPELLAVGEARGRPIQYHELETMTRWRDQIKGNASTLVAESNFLDSADLLMRERRMWVLKHKGELVACMGFGLMLPEAVQMAGLFAPPNVPRDDYCASVLAAALLDARASGARMAVMGLDEESANLQKTLESLGFNKAGQERTIILKESLFL